MRADQHNKHSGGSLLTPDWKDKESIAYVASVLRRVGLQNPAALALDSRAALSRVSRANDWQAWLISAGYPSDASQRLANAIHGQSEASKPEQDTRDLLVAIRTSGFTRSMICTAAGIREPELSYALQQRAPSIEQQERIYCAIAKLRDAHTDDT